MEITVLTPSYQYGRFIPDCVESVMNQDTQCLVKHVVQDGASSDETALVIERYQSAYDLTFRSEPDAGQSDALNKALSNAKSTGYVGWLNADEYYLQGALEWVRSAAAANPGAAVIFGDCVFVDEDGRALRAVPAHRMSRRVLRHYGCFLSSCAVFVRRDLLVSEPWDPSLREAMDWDLWLTLVERGKFVYVPQPLGAFRVHGAQVTKLGTGGDPNEASRIRAKHRIRDSWVLRTLGRWEHRLLKLLDGSYRRQRYMRSLRGQSFVWWRSEK